MKTVWIVSEGSPGHVSQSVGLVDELSKSIDVKTVEVHARTSVRGWKRPLIQAYMGRKGRPLSDGLLKRIAEIDLPNGSGIPDLIVSSGGKSVFAARSWAARCQVPFVFIGERKPFSPGWFHTLITPDPNETSANAIPVELIPTPVSAESIAVRAPQEKGVWLMVVGGKSRSHGFEEADWVGLAQGMNALAEQNQIRWLLTTSRRTGAAAEAVLKTHLNEGTLADAIWWAEKPRRELYDFMARAEMLFVTQDSVTMVTEAVSSGKPVVAVRPECVNFSADSFLPAYFKRLEENKRILRIRSTELDNMAASTHKFTPILTNVLEPVASELIKRLNWM